MAGWSDGAGRGRKTSPGICHAFLFCTFAWLYPCLRWRGYLPDCLELDCTFHRLRSALRLFQNLPDAQADATSAVRRLSLLAFVYGYYLTTRLPVGGFNVNVQRYRLAHSALDGSKLTPTHARAHCGDYLLPRRYLSAFSFREPRVFISATTPPMPAAALAAFPRRMTTLISTRAGDHPRLRFERSRRNGATLFRDAANVRALWFWSSHADWALDYASVYS